MRRIIQAAALPLVLGVSGAARAQTYQVQLQPDRFVTTSDPTSIALTESAGPLAPRTIALGMDLRLGGAPLTVCVQDADGACAVEGDLVGDRVGTDVSLAIGFGRFGLHAQLPMVLHQRSDFEPAMGDPALSSAGIGDLRIGAKAWLVRTAGVTLGADLTCSAPTAIGDFVGDAGTVIEPRAIVDWRRGKLALVGSLGYALRTSPQTIDTLYIDDELVWNAGVEYALTPDKLSLGVAVFGRIGVMTQPDPMRGDGAPSDAERMTETLATARYWATPAIAIEAGVGTALDPGYGAPTYRVLAGVRWVLRPQAAPVIAPEPEPEPTPILDTDGDGVLDDRDACVDVAEDDDAFEDDDGCPDPDNDRDGVADAADGCPLDAEDRDQLQDEDGCAEDDADGDGLSDATDACPSEPETANGYQDDDGCADDPPKLEVTTEIADLDETIYFDLDKAKLKKRSHKLLDAVVDALEGSPDVRVRIEGHTDETGDAAWNQQLSEARAEAVRDYLVAKGIAADRLEAVGYGNTRPVVVGTTEAARRKNRRVEFLIID